MKKIHIVSEAGKDSAGQHIFQIVGVDPLAEDEVTLVLALKKRKEWERRRDVRSRREEKRWKIRPSRKSHAVLVLCYTSASELSRERF